jgi:hypothetical protein
MTVTGVINDANGVARGGVKVTFTPETNPAASSTSKVMSAVPVSTTTATTTTIGSFSVTLLEGTYRVQIGRNPEDVFHIYVPVGSASVAITTLIVVPAIPGMTYVPGWFIPAFGTNYQYNSGALQVKNATTNLFHTLWVTGEAGLEQLLIETPGNVSIVTSGFLPARGTNYRLKDGHIQLYNNTTEQWYSLWVTGAEGLEDTALGAAED